MAQFLLEDALIVAIDESHFRSDALPKKQWQFDDKYVDRQGRIEMDKQRSKIKTSLLKVDEGLLEHGQMLRLLSCGEEWEEEAYEEMEDEEDRQVVKELCFGYSDTHGGQAVT